MLSFIVTVQTMLVLLSQNEVEEAPDSVARLQRGQSAAGAGQGKNSRLFHSADAATHIVSVCLSVCVGGGVGRGACSDNGGDFVSFTTVNQVYVYVDEIPRLHCV